MGQLASRGWEAEMKQARWAGRVWKVGGTQGTGRGGGGTVACVCHPCSQPLTSLGNWKHCHDFSAKKTMLGVFS